MGDLQDHIDQARTPLDLLRIPLRGKTVGRHLIELAATTAIIVFILHTLLYPTGTEADTLQEQGERYIATHGSVTLTDLSRHLNTSRRTVIYVMRPSVNEQGAVIYYPHADTLEATPALRIRHNNDSQR